MFATGQIWKYKTRPHETASRLIVGQVERLESLGTVVHIKIVGLAMRGRSGKTYDEIGHTPITIEALRDSVTERVPGVGDISGILDGRTEWLNAKGGAFTLPVAEIVVAIESITQ